MSGESGSAQTNHSGSPDGGDKGIIVRDHWLPDGFVNSILEVIFDIHQNHHISGSHVLCFDCLDFSGNGSMNRNRNSRWLTNNLTNVYMIPGLDCGLTWSTNRHVHGDSYQTDVFYFCNRMIAGKLVFQRMDSAFECTFRKQHFFLLLVLNLDNH